MKEKFSPKNIIIRLPNWIGDLVMATPVLADLRKAFPGARITAMCRAPLEDLLKEDPDIDELFSFQRASGFGRRSDRRNIIQKLRQGEYDLGILLTHSFSSAWWFWQGKVKRRMGYNSHARRFLLTDPVPLPEKVEHQHLVLTYKMLLQPLGIPVSSSLPRLFLSEKEREEARDLLARHGVASDNIVVGINPGAAYGSAKCWLPERFREVTDKLLRDERIVLVYFGDQASRPVVNQICQGFSARVVNLAGLTSLRELASLLSLCKVLLTNDSGPMHIAAALMTPVVALFGSTSEAVTGPYQRGVVIHKHVACSPCYRRTCPIDFRCMKEIGVEEVYAQVVRLMCGGQC